MFCASSRWDCQWPIGEEDSGVKGGWRFNWYHRWRLPPVNWWRFYGVVANEDGYTLYEFSDPPILGNDKMPEAQHKNGWTNHRSDQGGSSKRYPHLPYAVHGFARRIATKMKGSWWGYDIHKHVDYRKVMTCTAGWTGEDFDSHCGGKQCECTKDWDQIEGYKMRKMRDRDARIWTG